MWGPALHDAVHDAAIQFVAYHTHILIVVDGAQLDGVLEVAECALDALQRLVRLQNLGSVELRGIGLQKVVANEELTRRGYSGQLFDRMLEAGTLERDALSDATKRYVNEQTV